ncbi:MAG TPA: hypothetical protein VN229_23205 [Terriglobales bacterium]|nr:hypothetical protein [Terriglobales bacterium]
MPELTGHILMPIAGVIVGWFIDKDVPSYGLCQVAVSYILFVAILFILALGPWKLFHWHRKRRSNKSARQSD